MRELFASIEQLYEDGTNIGTSERFFALVEANISTMPVRLFGWEEFSFGILLGRGGLASNRNPAALARPFSRFQTVFSLPL